VSLLTPEALYIQLGELITEMPGFQEYPLSGETHRWVGRAFALLEQTGVTMDAGAFKVAAEKASGPDIRRRDEGVETIKIILYRALGRVELRAPATLQGTFVPVGSPYDALMKVGQVLSAAAADVLIIDPYADEKLLNSYALLAPEKIALRVLSDQKGHKQSLKPVAEAWIEQYGALRPLEVRLASPGVLHDRLIIIDRRLAFDLGQSFNALAKRSPTSLIRSDPETASLKIAAYEQLWETSQPL
jgi:hypothetical protein